MALTKSLLSQYQSSYDSQPSPETQALVQEQSAAPVENTSRRGSDFGRKTNSPTIDTYVKLRFSDTPDMPETWFKLNVRSDGVHAFVPTTREHPVVLLMNKEDSKLRMYHVDNAGNFDAVGQQRFEGVLAEIHVRKRRDSTPENPQMFLAGVYFAEDGRSERELRGNVVGAHSKNIMQGLSYVALQEWKAAQPARDTPPLAAAAAQKQIELVAGEELNFGI